MTLENKDILQINATIIAGALVFIIVSSISDIPSETVNRLGAVALSLGIILNFALSSINTINGKTDAAIRGIKYGLIYTLERGKVKKKKDKQ